MSTASSVFLSGGTGNGRPLKVTAIAVGSAQTLHTVDSATGTKDFLWIWLVNTGAADVVATLCMGGVTDPDDLLKFTVPANAGAQSPVLAGVPLGAGLSLKIFAASANVINAYGFVIRDV